MEFIYNVPDELKHYDEVFKDWNEMVNMNIGADTKTIVEQVVTWWENYPQKEEKSLRIDYDEAPKKVWDIFDKFKITRTEKTYGIFYTLEYILGEDLELEISSIQFNDNGKVDLAVIMDDIVICDNTCHDSKTLNITVLNKMNSTIKA
jgi:hypothetical protein